MTNTTLEPRKFSENRIRFAFAIIVASIITLLGFLTAVIADSGDQDHMDGSMGFWGNMNLLLVIFFIVWVVIAIIVANDASRRGENGLLWGVLVLIMPMMGIFVYLVYIAIKSSQSSTIGTSQPTFNPATQTIPSRGYINPTTPPISQPLPSVSAPVTKKESNKKIIYCVSCGAPNNITAQYCQTCGEKLPKINK